VEYNEKTGRKIETAEMNFFRTVSGYTIMDQIRNTKITEELSIFYLNNQILKSRSQWKYHALRIEDRWIQKKI
jgi:sulfur carrier protein ThiS